jgi:signal transduction histidine kinase/transcriptional regulator with GAF, ATPase, and Fis domain
MGGFPKGMSIAMAEPERSAVDLESGITDDPGRESRSVAQLNMLHTLAARLARLTDPDAIGQAITGELGTIIDYHNCRIYLLDEQRALLVPVALRGRLGEYEDETFEELVTAMGEGITGRVAELGESFSTPNAMDVEWSVTIEGTDDIDESMMAVPMKYGDRVVGVIVLSKLGVGQFDDGDLRLLEVLAPHAGAAFENARLLRLEREEAERSAGLVRLSTSLTSTRDLPGVMRTVTEALPEVIDCALAAAFVQEQETGSFRMIAAVGHDPTIPMRPSQDVTPFPRDIAASLLRSTTEPFVVEAETFMSVPREYLVTDVARRALVVPLRWDPDGFGALSILAPDDEATFGEREYRLAKGVADITSLALGTATRFHELERFHDLVEGLDAVFWEADATSLQFTFLSSRAEQLLGPDLSDWRSAARTWGQHVLAQDRREAEHRLRELVRAGHGGALEYRAATGDESAWLRDIVGLVRGRSGEIEQIRGLMVDITERKRAEHALRWSERKYSEAFEREREATSRLRNLDEMKNTFLEAVSHDLRTPLTSILGSAITLEQSELELPREDAVDLVRRIAANARKLERLLGDLLDLDRLQRGIVTPQRRPTDVGALVRLVCSQTEVLGERPVELDLEPVIASVDAAKVERIVENLLVNAARHTSPGVSLWVRVRPGAGGVLLTVEDDGPGVPEAMREAIFEPFRQVPEAAHPSPGVGIGLSLVARFAELHGGRAWVEEREGGGASFRVLLPEGGPDDDRGEPHP